jgi:hypothetical protein
MDDFGSSVMPTYHASPYSQPTQHPTVLDQFPQAPPLAQPPHSIVLPLTPHALSSAHCIVPIGTEPRTTESTLETLTVPHDLPIYLQSALQPSRPDSVCDGSPIELGTSKIETGIDYSHSTKCANSRGTLTLAPWILQAVPILPGPGISDGDLLSQILNDLVCRPDTAIPRQSGPSSPRKTPWNRSSPKSHSTSRDSRRPCRASRTSGTHRQQDCTSSILSPRSNFGPKRRQQTTSDSVAPLGKQIGLRKLSTRLSDCTRTDPYQFGLAVKTPARLAPCI